MEVELIALLETVQSPVHDLRLMMGKFTVSRLLVFLEFRNLFFEYGIPPH